MSKKLKDLSKLLDLTVKELKGLMSSNKNDNELITLNMANACRGIAQWTGYKDEESCKKAIKGQINRLYLDNITYADFFKKNIISHYNNKLYIKILEDAHNALEQGDFTTFNKVLRANKHLKKYCKKTAKKVNFKLVDSLRDTAKGSSSDAKNILNKVNKGKKILITR